MEFTEIHQISSFSLPSLQPNYYHHTPSSLNPSIITQNHSEMQNDPEIIEALQKITQLHLNQNQPHQNDSLQNKIAQNNPNCNLSTVEEEQVSFAQKKYDRTKSIIFASSLSTRKSLQSSDQGLSVRVYYFGTPFMKIISFNKKSTIKQLIRKSLDAYLLQNNHAIQASQPAQRFQMRLPNTQNQFTPDLTIEPIHYERILSENMFQTLVLLEKTPLQNSQSQNKNLAYESKPTKQYSVDDSSLQDVSFINLQNSKQKVALRLMDEKYFQLFRVQLDRQGTLQPIFKQVKQRDLNEGKQFVIKQDPESEFDLSQEHEVRLIEKNRLYLMTKRYLDQAEDQLPGPIRLKALIHQQLNYLPPLGMTQASRYEEFQVTKISSLGIAIDRILGIDQTKIYNYQKQLKNYQRQTNLIDKFLGLNSQTGTKIPFRFIKQIVKIQKFPGGIEVVFPEKTTTFIIKNQANLQKIHRKLTFLLDLNKNPSNTSSFTDFKIPKRIASLLNF